MNEITAEVLTLACAFGRCLDCPDPAECQCSCGHVEVRCTDCGLAVTADPSRLCEECQPGHLSELPESITADQERAITAACTDLGILVFADIDYYSQRMAGDVLEVLERARRARKERTR